MVKKFNAFNTRHSISVLGLYADTVNSISIRLITEDDAVYTGNVEMKTAPLSDVFPTVEVSKIDRSKMEPNQSIFSIAHSACILQSTSGRWECEENRWVFLI